MQATLPLPVSASMPMPTGSLEAYIQTVNRFPLLSAEEERTLALRFQRNGDLEAARALVLSHLRLVVALARGYLGYGLPHADLIQEGNIGLMKAVKRFDPDRGTRLVTYATYWIRARILDFILRSHGPVRIGTTRAQRRVFFGLARARRLLERRGLDPDALHLAELLGVADREVESMASRLAARDLALDAQAAVSRVPALTDGARSPEEILADAEESSRLARNGRARVEAEFSWDAVADRLVAIFEELRRG